MKWLFLLIVGAFIGTGCGQRDSQANAQPAPDSLGSEITATLPLATEAPVDDGGETASKPELVGEQVGEEAVPGELAEVPTSEVPLPATAELPTATIQLTPTEEVVFNGVYENTYFRGAADAPVTILDYSDFL